VNGPAARSCELEHLAIHDEVSAALMGARRCTATSVGKSGGRARSEFDRVRSARSAAIYDPVVGRRRHRHCPAEIMRDAQPHAAGL
jgi:hypothetical protein